MTMVDHTSAAPLLTEESSSSETLSRYLRNGSIWFWNQTVDDEFTNLKPASDVSVNAVMSTVFFNTIVLIFLMICYEILRRILPSVYSARKVVSHYRAPDSSSSTSSPTRSTLSRDQSVASIPSDSFMPMDWVGPVLGVSWERVREVAGLDGYFFLRYLRMCMRITLVSSFWAFIILVPVFATGHNEAKGWYHISIVNISSDTWRMWIPTIFIYLFSGFTFFVMKQEYRHFLQLRMDFLGKGDSHVHPQHHYSLMVENIPLELRSDNALHDYFDNLFPGKVHSARVMLKLPDLQDLSTRRLRVLRRLEKSIAYVIASGNGERPKHVIGRARVNCLGIDMFPIRYFCLECRDGSVYEVDDESPLPPKGTMVDSISYYTRDLAECNRDLFILQRSKKETAETGNASIRADTWFASVVNAASGAFNDVANDILEESLEDNALKLQKMDTDALMFPKAERMTSSSGWYGSLDATPVHSAKKTLDAPVDDNGLGESDATQDRKARLIDEDHLRDFDHLAPSVFEAPGRRDKERHFLRRMAGRLGLDFFVAGVKFANKNLDVVVDNVVGKSMSSTGFVTFLDLTSVTCAAGAPLTLKPGVLNVSVAPEPRDIRWKDAHFDAKLSHARETVTNILLGIGVIFWSVPLTAIQAFATAEQVARIPGMEWILTFDGGSISAFINGYLPVMALLGLILLLPVIFEWIAVSYERRKTFSDVQRSMVGRYFYYQLANIYITVTAGSLWNSLADILDHPSNVLEILGRSLPTVVGYFVSLLITKIMAGLPMVILRMGALGRMVFLRAVFSRDKLTQRELDEVYRPSPVMYGWEYPSQLLVIVICFTYACISPVILPVGAMYFLGALMVYKKQILYVYTPTYESGATFFPMACDRTLFGLFCGQLTFIGYTVIRECYHQPVVLFPLPFITLWVMRYFDNHYASPSNRLSLERAIECDRMSDVHASMTEGLEDSASSGSAVRSRRFNKNAYRQPVLTEGAMVPLPYRRGTEDPLTTEATDRLNRFNRRHESMYRAWSGCEDEKYEDALSVI